MSLPQVGLIIIFLNIVTTKYIGQKQTLKNQESIELHKRPFQVQPVDISTLLQVYYFQPLYVYIKKIGISEKYSYEMG